SPRVSTPIWSRSSNALSIVFSRAAKSGLAIKSSATRAVKGETVLSGRDRPENRAETMPSGGEGQLQVAPGDGASRHAGSSIEMKPKNENGWTPLPHSDEDLQRARSVPDTPQTRAPTYRL